MYGSLVIHGCFFSFGLSVNADRVVGIEEKKGRIKPGDAKEEYRLGF